MAMPRLLNGYYGMEGRLWAQFQLFSKYRIGCQRRNDVNAPFSAPNHQGALSKYYSFTNIRLSKLNSSMYFTDTSTESSCFNLPVMKLLDVELVLPSVTD